MLETMLYYSVYTMQSQRLNWMVLVLIHWQCWREHQRFVSYCYC